MVCDGVWTAAPARVARGARGAFRGGSVHGAACCGRDLGVARDTSGVSVADLADSRDPCVRAVPHECVWFLVGPVAESSSIACADRVAGRRGDGDDLRDGLGTGARDRVGTRRSGDVGGHGLVGAAGGVGLEPVVSGGRSGTDRARLGAVVDPGARGAWAGGLDGYRDRVLVSLVAYRAHREGRRSRVDRESRAPFPCAGAELVRSGVRRRPDQSGDVREPVVREGLGV